MKPLSTWFAYGFSLLAVAAVGAAAFLLSWIWLASGGVLAVMAIAFLALGNISRAQFGREREIAQGLSLAAALPEDDLRKRLYTALSLHFCGARAETLGVSPRPQRALPPVVVKKEKGRRRGRGRRRGGRRDRGLVLLECR